MTDTIVFLGPSLSHAAARKILDADYRPPAARGDIFRCLGSGVRRIALIDGVFHATPSVWHREILAAIDEGIEVLGASSMGALRAAELAPFGMIGCGTIFGWYRDGVIDGDDEVALLHGDADSGWRALSEPLVNVRATLARALSQGQLTVDEAEALLADAKRTFYPRRSLRQLAAVATGPRWSDPRRREIERALAEARVDLKRADAELLLLRCATTAPATRPPIVGAHDFAVSGDRARARVLAGGETGVELLEKAEAEGRLARVLPEVTLRWYVSQWAHHRDISLPASVRAELGVRDHVAPADLDAWLRRRSLTRGEYETWRETRALSDWLATQPGLVASAATDRDGRLRALAHDWLREWGIDAGGELPEPRELGFTWPREHALLVELLIGQEAP